MSSVSLRRAESLIGLLIKIYWRTHLYGTKIFCAFVRLCPKSPPLPNSFSGCRAHWRDVWVILGGKDPDSSRNQTRLLSASLGSLSFTVLTHAVICPSAVGASVSTVPHPGGWTLLQWARVRALPWDSQRHPKLTGIRRQHPAGHRQMGHAGADAQPLTMF